MRRIVILVLAICLSSSVISSSKEVDYTDYTDLIIQLQFLSARDKALILDKDNLMPYYAYLAEFFGNAGQLPQVDSVHYSLVVADSLSGQKSLNSLLKGVYLLFNSEDNSEAFIYLNEAMKLAEEEGKYHLLKLSYFAILELYVQEITLVSNDYNKYLDNWKQLMTTSYDEAWYHLFRFILISKKVNVEEARKEFPDATEDFENFFKSHVLNERIMTYYFFNKAIYLKDIASLLKGKGNFPESEVKWGEAAVYFKKTIGFGKNENYLMHNVFMAHLHLAEAYSELGRSEEAEPVLKQARKFWNMSDITRSNYLQDRYSSFYYYEKTGKYDSAYLLLKNATLLERTMDYRKNSLKISELSVQLEVTKKEKEVLETKKSLANSTKWIWFIVTLLIIISSLLLILYKAFRKIKDQNSEIRLTNSSIKEKNIKIETLMKELHHRVKNNLQIISSLLGLQSMKLKDESAKKAVTEGKERIRAMSLIHQRLYQNELVTSLNIRDYISDLVDDISKSYGEEKDVSLSIKVPSVEMDADNAMPIGLIINELVTNAFKYAFKDLNYPAQLKLSLEKSDQHYLLIICDNGVGLPAEEHANHKASFGMKLVTLLVNKQLKGMMEVESDQGVTYKILFPISKLTTHENNKSIDR